MPRPKLTPETIARAQAEQERLDAVPMTVRCAEPGCERWSFSGTTGECRDVAAAHRDGTHPGVAAARARERARTEKQRKAREQERKATQRKSLLAPPKRPGRPETSREDAILAILAVSKEKGRPPKSTEWASERRSPRLPTLYRLFGSWAGAMDAAGLKPYSRRERRVA